ncbi:MAG: ATP-binding protein, partial [Boseongicola sp.]
LIMTLIALLYLRGQIRPIRRLAAAATAFGKGRMLQYQPSGAAEVREAGKAFLQMRDRIERQIEQRTLMLSGVSHDLRTPLTRMRLALSLLEDPESGTQIAKDVEEMDRMLNAFLDFAKAEALDDPELTSPIKIAREAIEKATRSGSAVSAGQIDQADELELRPMALSRALDNLIGNAIRYGTSARVSLNVDDSSIRFIIEDDGPGIAAKDRDAALKPFSRLDQSRNQDAGSGVGLGLAIANDIARQHGGHLNLGESASMGGLSAEISIPR